jgi:hypothetical protein
LIEGRKSARGNDRLDAPRRIEIRANFVRLSFPFCASDLDVDGDNLKNIVVTFA